jgi:hypothetical protein
MEEGDLELLMVIAVTRDVRGLALKIACCVVEESLF